MNAGHSDKEDGCGLQPPFSVAKSLIGIASHMLVNESGALSVPQFIDLTLAPSFPSMATSLSFFASEFEGSNLNLHCYGISGRVAITVLNTSHVLLCRSIA